MIEFNYSLSGDEITITLKTDSTEIGTFHRMATVIYCLDWDILSGDIRTLEENGVKYSFDMLKLKTETKNAGSKALELGILMDTVFSGKSDLSNILKERNIQPLETRKFFKHRAELVFEDDRDKGATVFYIEAESGKGLLYHVTKVLVDHKIDILNATIETDPNTGVAQDTFYLLDEEGNLFGRTPKAEAIKESILKPF
jgi:UTP:GlnB (protein PII) uridylyltransferase